MRHSEVGLPVDLGSTPVWSARHDMVRRRWYGLDENAWAGSGTWRSALRSARAITCLTLMRELYPMEVEVGRSGAGRFRAELDLPIAWTITSGHMPMFTAATHARPRYHHYRCTFYSTWISCSCSLIIDERQIPCLAGPLEKHPAHLPAKS